MIWFSCSQCGKKHSRPEADIGSLIFCDCGQGNTVPWESTVAGPQILEAEEESPEIDAVPPPLPPRLEPVPIGEERLPVARPTDRSRPRPNGRRSPDYCFNHGHLPSEKICFECEERFCANCIVQFQDKDLCGPCKNALIRRDNKSPRLSALAVVALLGGLLMGPIGFCVLPFQMTNDWLPVVLMAVLVQLGIVAMGLIALYKMESQPHLRGRSLAVTGVVAAGIGVLLVTAATMYSFGGGV